MANTYTLISSNTLTSSAASVTFSSIPSTYTDLVLRVSSRTDRSSTSDQLRITFNGDTATNYSYISLVGYNNAASSQNLSNAAFSANYYTDGNTATANTFNSAEIYIPNYLVSANKSFSGFSASEDNSATTALLTAVASLWRNTAAVTSIGIVPATGPNFVSGSSFYLYGIKNS